MLYVFALGERREVPPKVPNRVLRRHPSPLFIRAHSCVTHSGNMHNEEAKLTAILSIGTDPG